MHIKYHTTQKKKKKRKKNLFGNAVVACPVLTPTQHWQEQWVVLGAAHTQTSYTSEAEFGFAWED